MSAIFGEMLTFGQANGPDVQLYAFGDEYYARHEDASGFTVSYDTELGLFTYATVIDGRFVSSGVPMTKDPPAGLRRHLEESEAVRHEKYTRRRTASLPPPSPSARADTLLTLGPNQGLLTGRRLSTGVVRGLTILVEFQDLASAVTRNDVTELLNGQNYTRNGNFCSARDYFKLVSSNKLDYSNDVFGPYRLSHNRQYYVDNLLVKEALDLAVADGVDLTRYDSKHEGIVDALNILYAGQTQYLGELWPHNSFVELHYGQMRTNLYLLTSQGRTAADLSIGTFCHENGHLLCRFPDMYDYGNRDGDGVESAGIGVYCLMGAGNHLNAGRTPSPVCGYLRYLAGWCDNVVLLNQPGAHDAEHGAYNTVFKYETDKPSEYFIVENRSKIGLDQHLPANGLAVYHCDTQGSNELQEGSSTRHYQCALLQADGHLDLEHNINQGDGGDLYGTVAGIALSHGTTPPSRQWDGADSGLVISAVDPPGQTIGFTVGQATDMGAVTGADAPNAAIPDDNPAGVSSTIAIGRAGTVRRITVSVDITHTYIGDLVVDLTDPSGTTAALHNRTGAGQDNIIRSFSAADTPALGVFIGRQAQGNWVLRVRDLAGRDIGKFNRWSIEIGMDAADQAVHGEAAPATPIPDNNPTGITSSIALPQAGTIRQIKASIDIAHTYVGDLRVELVSPGGRSAVLQSRVGGGQDNLVTSYSSTGPGSALAAFIGQSSSGTWVLRVADLAAADVGRLNKWSLDLTVGA